MSAARKPEGESKGRTPIPPALRIAPIFYRVDDAALALGVSERKVWQLIRERGIPSRKIDSSYVTSLPVIEPSGKARS